MTVLPFQINAREYSVIMAFDEEGLGRIRQYDPGELHLYTLGPPWTLLKLKDVIVTYCTASDLDRVLELCRAGDTRAACRWLTRGFKFRPEEGDHDQPPVSLKKENPS